MPLKPVQAFVLLETYIYDQWSNEGGVQRKSVYFAKYLRAPLLI